MDLLFITDEEINNAKATLLKNSSIADYYLRYSKEKNSVRMQKKASRISECGKVWIWDLYRQNKLMDLKQMFLCKDKFCLNCSKIYSVKSLLSFKPVFERMTNSGYKAYHMVLTVPNIEHISSKFISTFRESFNRFYHRFSNSDRYTFKYKEFTFDGGVCSIEVIKGKDNNWHPHFHSLIFIKDGVPEDMLLRSFKGRYDYKINDYILLNKVELQIKKVWFLEYNREYGSGKGNTFNDKYTELDSLSLEDVISKTYECSFNEIENDMDGMFEVFKYITKTSSLKSYDEFIELFEALDRKRKFQTFGAVYNQVDEEPFSYEFINEGVTDIIKKMLKFEENPETISTDILNGDLDAYRGYTKTSRNKRKKLILSSEQDLKQIY